MKIGFITSHLGIFGSIRELIENANELSELGHEVVIYNLMSDSIDWLNCKARIVKSIAIKEHLDALIMMDSPYAEIYKAWDNAKAKFKTFVMMGFDPNNFVLDLSASSLTLTEKNLIHILENYIVCADSSWQLDYFREHGINTGVAIGGINLRQFENKNQQRLIHIGYSGDTRTRKGTSVLENALSYVGFSRSSYFNKGDQKFLVDFLNNCEIFIDNHLRAGWCNPVLEAMSCGCVCVCNDIGAVRDFAINKETAIVLKENTAEQFAYAMNYLMTNPNVMANLRSNAHEKVKEFDYKIVSKKLADFLELQI